MKGNPSMMTIRSFLKSWWRLNHRLFHDVISGQFPKMIPTRVVVEKSEQHHDRPQAYHDHHDRGQYHASVAVHAHHREP